MARTTIKSCNAAFFNSTVRVGLSIALMMGACLDAASQGTAVGMPVVEAVTYDGPKVTPHEFTSDLRHLPLALPTQAPAERPYRPLLRPPVQPKIPSTAAAAEKAAAISGPLVPMPSPAQNFVGMSRADTCTGGQCGGGIPPDTNGDVGPNHYIQAVNTAYAIYDKTGMRLASFTENQLWAGTGTTPCNGNSRGDPVVLYDWLADRWILTHLAFASNSGPFYQCIAASKTSDPVTGGWWLYAVRMDPGGTGQPSVGRVNDYPKFGLWHDCLYMGANQFDLTTTPETYGGVAFASFSRSDLYSGAALTYSLGVLGTAGLPFTLVPSNNQGKGANAAQPGTPNYFVSESSTAYAFEVRKFTAGANCGSGGTLSAMTSVSQAAYPFVTFGNVVPQPNTTNMLDNIDDRIMQKVQYRRIGGAESLWVTHNVDTPSGTTAMQWAQIDVTGGTIAPTPVQQQIYAPDTTLNRWMGSLAVDQQGNMALGYSTSNATSPNFPSIAYSGRLATDPPNTLPQTEVQLVAGAGSQTNNCGGAVCPRWGDYTAMSVDPADDCTFWYTNQYYSNPETGAIGNWQTRIGSFKFPSCSAPTDQVPACTLTASPSTISFGGSATLTATCSPAATSYAWTPAPGLVPGPANTATVMPTAVGIHQYSVTGSNAGGAGNTASTSVTVTCTYSIFPTSQSVTASATTGTLSVTSPAGCAWTASSNVDWITITSGSSGSGNGTVVYAVAANPSSRSSTGTLTVAGQTFTVTQAGLTVPACTLTASPSTITAGGSATLTATCSPAATSYAWTNTGFAATASAGTVSPTVTTTYSVIGSNAAGSGNTASASVTVTCTYSISPSSQSVAAGATTGTLSVTSPSGCAWTAGSNADWITITTGSSGSGNGTVAYAVAANPSGSSRTGTLTIAGQTFTVTQAGLAVPTCTLTASSSTITAGQSSILTATCSPAATSYAWTNTGFAATASTGSVSPTVTTTYLVIGSNAAGSGNTASATVTVTCTYSLSPTSQSVTASATTGTLSVIATSGCAWTASSNVDWITITSGSSGSGNGTVVYSVAANPSSRSSIGTLTVAGQTFTVTQAGITVPAFNSQSDCLFNWAEITYASFFAPAGAVSNTLAPYYYRYYPQTNAYLGTSSADNHVYYIGPLSNNSILDVGAMSPLLSTAGCL